MAAAISPASPTDAATAMIAAVVVAPGRTPSFQLVLIDRQLKQKVAPGPKAYAMRTWFATSVPIFMVGSFYLLLTYIDILVLQHFRTPDEVAVYYAAAKTLALVAFVYFSVAAPPRPTNSPNTTRRATARGSPPFSPIDPLDVLAVARRDRPDPRARQAVPAGCSARNSSTAIR